MIMTENFESRLSALFDSITREVLREGYNADSFKQSAIVYKNRASANRDKGRYFTYKTDHSRQENDFVVDNLLAEGLRKKLMTLEGINNQRLEDALRIFVFTTNGSANMVEEVIFSGIVKYTFNAAKKIVDDDHTIQDREKPYCYRSLAMTIGSAFYEILQKYRDSNESKWVNVFIRNDFLEYLALSLLQNTKKSNQDNEKSYDYYKKPLPRQLEDVVNCFADIARKLLNDAKKFFAENRDEVLYKDYCLGGFDLYEIDFLIDLCEHIYDILYGCRHMLTNPINNRLSDQERQAVQRVLLREFRIGDADAKKNEKEGEIRVRINKVIDAYLKYYKLMEFRKGSIKNYPTRNELLVVNAWSDEKDSVGDNVNDFLPNANRKGFFRKRNIVKLSERNFISNYTNKSRGADYQLSKELITFQHHTRARTLIHETFHTVSNYLDYAYVGGVSMYYDIDDNANSRELVFYFSTNCYRNGDPKPSNKSLIARKPTTNNLFEEDIKNKGDLIKTDKIINVDTFVKMINVLYFMYAKGVRNQRFIKDIYESRRKITDYLVANLHYAIKTKEPFYSKGPYAPDYNNNHIPTFVEKMEKDMWWKYWDYDYDALYAGKHQDEIESAIDALIAKDTTYDNLRDMFMEYTTNVERLFYTYFAEYVSGIVTYWHTPGPFEIVSYHANDPKELYELGDPIDDDDDAPAISSGGAKK